MKTKAQGREKITNNRVFAHFVKIKDKIKYSESIRFPLNEAQHLAMSM